MKPFFNPKLFLLIIFLIALGLRLYGLNWDQGQHLHPDERFLTMVTNDIKLPTCIGRYFNFSASPLNPFNYPNYQFFVYGTFPVFLTKALAVIFHLDDYGNIVLLGRGLSALFDSFNIFLLYFLGKIIFKKNSRLALLPPLIYAFTVLPLQLSHFYAVDTFLNTFLLASFTALAYDLFLPAAVLFGLALACKISAVFFAPVILLFLLRKLILKKKFFPVFFLALEFGLFAFITFRIFQPYAFSGFFTPAPQFLRSLENLETYSQKNIFYPPSVQWINTTPFIFPLKNIVLWGLGLFVSVPLFVALFINFKKIKKLFQLNLTSISIIWVVFLFAYQSLQPTYNLRYYLPIYPFLIIFLCQLINRRWLKFLVLGQFICCLAFLSIYSRPHSRVQASEWIYQNIPSGSRITSEYWDDALPLFLPGQNPGIYSSQSLSFYDQESPEKWQKLNPIINRADYLIMSSNRLWRSITSVPQFYPQTSQFYADLFDGKLPFQKVAEINSYPGFVLPLGECIYLGPTDYPYKSLKNSWFAVDSSCSYPGIYFRDDTAEESFTVYDHPKVLIFKRKI